MTESAEEIREFLVESHENLNALDRKIVSLERTPADEQGMASVSRAMHTLKGTSDFLGFHVISSVAHVLESLFVQVRENIRPLTPALVSVILEALDAVKQVLQTIEQTNEEGAESFELLRGRLSAAYQECGTREAPASATACSSEAGGPNSMQEPERRVKGAGGDRIIDRFEGTRETDRAASSTIRVDVLLLDKMLMLVDKLATTDDPGEKCTTERNGVADALEISNLLIRKLRECLMEARMQPIGVIWNKFPRAVRDVASEMGKIIDVQMDGALTELDKTIIEAICDPLMHMVRNACDHGIELPQIRVGKGKKPQGTISLRAFTEKDWVVLQVSDDGAGIDSEHIKSKALQKGFIQPDQAMSMTEQEALGLIFLPGLSTADAVSSVSGRGVGMDVVKTNIESVHGTVSLASYVDVGTTVTIRIPPRLR